MLSAMPRATTDPIPVPRVDGAPGPRVRRAGLVLRPERDLSGPLAEVRAWADEAGVVLLWTPLPNGGWNRRQVASLATSAYALAAIGPSTVAVATGEPTVPLLDVDSGDARSLVGHTLSVYAVAPGPHGTLLTGSHDGTARVWDLAAERTTMVYDEHDLDVSAFGVLGGGLVVSGSGDRSLRIWAAETGETFVVCALDQPIDCLAVNRSGDRLAVGHANGALEVFVVTGLGP